MLSREREKLTNSIRVGCSTFTNNLLITCLPHIMSCKLTVSISYITERILANCLMENKVKGSEYSEIMLIGNKRSFVQHNRTTLAKMAFLNFKSVSDNCVNFLIYKQEIVNHPRFTAACGYLYLLVSDRFLSHSRQSWSDLRRTYFLTKSEIKI